MSRLGTANILIGTTKTPFSQSGSEVFVGTLRAELNRREFCVDVIRIPFSAQPKDKLLYQAALWRALDVKVFGGKKVDLFIAVKFPAYLVEHPNKVTWLVSEQRSLSALPEPETLPHGIPAEAVRRMLISAKTQALNECSAVFAVSDKINSRLKNCFGINSTRLLPPLPLGSKYYCGEVGDYILTMGGKASAHNEARLNLLIKAFSRIDRAVQLKIVGVSSNSTIKTYLRSEMDRRHLWDRVTVIEEVSERQLVDLFANCLAVFWASPEDDFSFVPLEALASGKAVITDIDSRCVLEFVKNEENGLVVEPNEYAVANAVNRLFQCKEIQQKLSNAARDFKWTGAWDSVINNLVEEVFVSENV